MLPGVPMSWTCGCSNIWPFSRGSKIQAAKGNDLSTLHLQDVLNYIFELRLVNLAEFVLFTHEGAFNKYLVHTYTYIYIILYFYIIYILDNVLTFGLRLTCFAYICTCSLASRYEIHSPGHPVSTTCQACWQISEFLSNTSTNREKVGRAAKSKDGLFVDGMISLSTWHFGSPRLWEILGFLNVFDFAPKQTLQFTAKKKCCIERNHLKPPQCSMRHWF